MCRIAPAPGWVSQRRDELYHPRVYFMEQRNPGLPKITRSSVPLLLAVLAVALAPYQVRSQETSDEASSGGSPYRFDSIFKDIAAYATAPIRWDGTDWLYFGGAVAAVAAAHSLDGRVRTHFTTTQTPLNGKDPNSLSDAIPAAALVAGTFLYAVAIDDNDGRSETWSMLEAGGLSTATAYVLKFASGRERPNETTNDNEWRKGGSSFPSVHVTAAAAIGTVLAESGNDEYRWIRRFVGYGVAAGTAYLRLKHNEHWLSDTVAAAALGASSAHFTLNHEHRTDHASGLSLVPIRGGAMLSYTVPLR
jgi:membrane-associated phospholipid phosphatase